MSRQPPLPSPAGLGTGPDPLAQLRNLRGEATTLWAGTSTAVEPGRWSALTGAASPDYNVVLCHGSSGGAAFPRAIEDIAERRAPGLIMATGAALAEVQQLVRASWVCVGSLAFLRFDLSVLRSGEPDRDVRRLRPDELGEARELLVDVYDIDLATSHVALPEATADGPDREIWGIVSPDGEIVGCWAVFYRDDVASGWSLAVSPAHQRQGYATRLLRTALLGARDRGASSYLGNATVAALPLFTRFGFEVIEHWQVWSRPRWVMGRF